MGTNAGRWIVGRVRSWFSQIRTTLLFSYFIVILLCIALVGTASFYISYETMAERVESAGSQITDQIENNVDNDFHSKRNLLLAPYYDQEYIDGINAYSEMSAEQKFLFRQDLVNLYLKSFNATPIRGFNRFQIYYSTGELLGASDDYKPRAEASVRHSDWFLRTIAADGGVYFMGRSDGEGGEDADNTAYSSSILIRDFSNPERFIVVRVEYNDELFRTIGRSDDLTAGSQIVVLDQNSKPVYASGSLLGNDAAESELVERTNGPKGKFWFESGGEDMLVTYTRSDYSNWKIVLVMPRSEIFGPLDRIKTTVLYTALVAFAFTFLLSVLFGRSITKPILNLYKTVNRLKRGDFSERVAVGPNNEIGRIAMNFNAMQDELQTLIETKYVNQIKLQEVELKMLYSQINPHFLYNTLDSIRAMSDYYKVGEIGEMAQALADMFRYNTRNRDEVVTLQEELEQIEAYMKIQSIRFDDKIVFEQDIEEELYAFPVLKMTLQPLVENAVFHGIERKRGKGTIRISARREKEGVHLAVSDDGVGISEAHLNELRATLNWQLHRERWPDSASEGGIGVRNVYTRYAIRFGERMSLRIDSKKGAGTRITLILPDEEDSALPPARSEYST
ncbi:cache domain-containing sensor histidine kinase [Cohnella thailandensis]|uniref:histidine kinase n=1 Tax=Cohnella thailandensis TaxID=557557 RepID=A0A841ST18_9BACL|nr:sensor histidine kinase [Cohnella thailandensis]MBB6635084.1 sensor histidine kinase [Cohnella thailandensis]MBP1977899.1 two-component system sensor histidine kinase YesM [Cohnella thailandensis]